MLTELRVENLGIIAEAPGRAHRGLTAITGETGAGKTLLIDALELLCGGRADPQIVRDGEDIARVEGRFVVRRRGARHRAGRAGRRPLTRLRERPARNRIRARRARARSRRPPRPACAPVVACAGRTARACSIASPATRHVTRCAKLRAARERMREIDGELARLGGDERSRAREVDLLRYQLGEIESAALVERGRGRAARRGGAAARRRRGASRRACRRVRRARGFGRGCARRRGRGRWPRRHRSPT